jgi:hypothetical protein
MQSAEVVGLASAGVAALAIGASFFTTLLSLRAQRENTESTLRTQRALASAQEDFTRERSHAQELRRQRVPLYGSLIRWADTLLAALSEMDPEHAELAQSVWHVGPALEDSLDLYAPDLIHLRFNALRGLLMGLVKDSGFTTSPVVTWEYEGDRITNVSTTRTPPLTEWATRASIRDNAQDAALDFIHAIRAEVQGTDHSGWFVTYRLPLAR